MNVFLSFWKYLNKKDKFFFLTIVIFSILQAVFELLGIATIIPFVTFLLKPEALTEFAYLSNFLEDFQLTDINNYLIFFCALFFLIFLIKNLIIILANKLTYRFIYFQKKSIVELILKKILKQNYLFFVNNGSAKIFNETFQETHNFAANIIRPIISLLTELLICLSIFLLIILSKYTDGIFLIVAIVFIVALILKKINKSIKEWSNIRIFNTEKVVYLNFSLGSGIKEVLLYDNIERVLKSFSRALHSLALVDSKNAAVVTYPKILLEQSIILVLILIIISMNYIGKTNDEIIITLSFYLAVSYRLVPSINKIFVAYQQIKFGKPSIHILEKYHEMAPEINKSNMRQEIKENFKSENEKIKFNDVIKIENSAFSYSKNAIMFKDLNFSISKNQFIGIFGESGCGKSTFINLLLKLINFNEGKLFVDKRLILKQDTRSYQKLFTIAAQDSFLFNGTIKENIIYGSNESFSKERLDYAIHFARLEKFIDTLKDGINTDIGSNYKKLSSGQKQRLTIARSIYLDREIMIFDEATNALDDENEKAILKNINSIRLKKTLIMISHNLNNLKNCDKVYKIDNYKFELFDINTN